MQAGRLAAPTFANKITSSSPHRAARADAVDAERQRQSRRCWRRALGPASARAGRVRQTMTFFPGKDPAPGDAPASDAIELMIVPRSVDLGGFAVRRALPHVGRRMVGPFIFFDHFGPAEFRAGDGVDVRPHPHIGLATVTYLFDGEIVHRDSLGTAAAIHPGDVNLMTAGRGIVHSERTAPERRGGGERLHGLQCWVAMPAGDEEIAPSFAHHDQADLPIVASDRKRVRVVVGSLYGERSPVP